MGVAIYEVEESGNLTYIRSINEFSYGQGLQRPLFPQLGDRDGDGWEELYFIEDQTQTVHIVDPKIPSKLQTISSAGPVRDLRVVDLNYDGFDDIVVTTDLQIYVSYSNGQKHTELQPFSNTEISWIANRGSWIYDFNGDKSLDILVNGNENRILYGYKNGTAVEIYGEAAPTIEQFGQYINDGDFLDRAVLHDFDLDGKEDMLIPYWYTLNLVTGPTFDTYYQTPDFNPLPSTAQFTRVDYVDINLDGFDDFVAMGEIIIITENSGDFNDFGELRTYSRDMASASTGQRGTIKIDVNGDQHDDLIFVEGSQVFLLEAAKDFYIQYPGAQLLLNLGNSYDEDAGLMQRGNFVGDYLDDLIIPLQGGDLAVLEYINGSFSQELFTLAQWGPIIGSAQYDTDAYLELYIETTAPAQKFVDVVLNFDTPVPAVERLNIIAQDTGNFVPQAFNDINHDGKPDFVFTDTIYLYVWISTDGPTYYLADQITINSNILTTLLVDHDKDGFQDLIVITNQQIYLYWMVSTYLFEGNRHVDLIEFSISNLIINPGDSMEIFLVVRKDLNGPTIDTIKLAFQSASGNLVEAILFENPILVFHVIVTFYDPGEYSVTLNIEMNDGSSTSFGNTFSPLFTINISQGTSITSEPGFISQTSSEPGFTTQSDIETVTETISQASEDTGPSLPVPFNGYLVILSMLIASVFRRKIHAKP